MKTNYAGVDYSLGMANRNKETGFRYGVIPQHAVGESWYEDSKPWYGKPCCSHCGNELAEDFTDGPCPHCSEDVDEDDRFPDSPLFHYVDNSDLKAKCGECGDIFITHSKYFTYAQFCSPCAPGACYLLNWLEVPSSNNRAYCFGPDWFEDGNAPYPIFSVETGLPAQFPHPENHVEGFEP